MFESISDVSTTHVTNVYTRAFIWEKDRLQCLYVCISDRTKCVQKELEKQKQQTFVCLLLPLENLFLPLPMSTETCSHLTTSRVFAAVTHKYTRTVLTIQIVDAGIGYTPSHIQAIGSIASMRVVHMWILFTHFEKKKWREEKTKSSLNVRIPAARSCLFYIAVSPIHRWNKISA